MKTLNLLLIAAVLIFSGCRKSPEQDTGSQLASILEETSTTARDGMFIHITTGPEDPHRVLMALHMARIMAEDRDVLVYFDIKAVEVVRKGAENITHPAFPSSHEQLSALMELGVELQVCPGCLKAAGLTEDDVMEGVAIADKEKFFTFTSGRILSIDY
jgi:predicted peroxiredoxin